MGTKGAKTVLTTKTMGPNVAAVIHGRFIDYVSGGIAYATAGGGIVGVSDVNEMVVDPYAISTRQDIPVVNGIVPVQIGSADIADGAEIAVGANGIAVTATAGDVVVGKAVGAETTDDGFILVDTTISTYVKPS